MKTIPIPNTDLTASSFSYGVAHFGTRSTDDQSFELYSRFREAGGNLFDTAHGYACWLPNGDGASETSLGKCMKKFGDRDELVITTKGGLPDFGTVYPRPDDYQSPATIAGDITDSLNRLQIDTIDIYLLHRDDTRLPIGAAIETLNAEIKRGRIRYIGASNWTIERIVASNEYAASHGLQGFIMSSPQFNLAYPNHAPLGWAGPDPTAVYLSDDDVAWHRKHYFPLMPYTATAYGYFDGAASENPMSFDNPTNRARRERARTLASEYGCTPTQIALAYLLAYEFPVFPILGTMSPKHLSEAVTADNVVLTPEQRDWLRDG